MMQWQYRELCRLCVADHFGVPLAEVRTRQVPGPVQPGQRHYPLAIDLLWVTENVLARYVHIAAVFRRPNRPVQMPYVLLMQKCKEKIGAHKVVLFSCCGFAPAARAAAASDRMDLYVVRPLFELHLAPARSPVTFRRRLEAFSRTHGRPYSLQIL